MPPAARITDMHVCPMVTVLVPHVGGPILPPGAPTVLIDMLPAATFTSMATCVGPPDMIVMGSPTCIIGEVGTPSPGMGGFGAVMGGLAASGASQASQQSSPSPSAPAPSAGGQTPAANTGDPLTPALMKEIDKSPLLSSQIDSLKKAGWKFKSGIPDKGTFADRSNNTVTIDPKMASDTPTLLMLLAHEVGHAMRPAPPAVSMDKLTKQQYVDQVVKGALLDEADATINNIKVQEELAKKGVNIGVAGKQGDEFKKLYDDDPSTARDKIADKFGTGENPSNDPTKTYQQYYSKDPAAAYDKANPGGVK